MDPKTFTVGLAFIAGLASFLSPCVLSLVPAYLGYLGSRVVTPGGQTIENRWVTLSHGAAFVLGFSAVFIAIGLAVGALGTLLYTSLHALIQFGPYTLGPFRAGPYSWGLIQLGGIVVVLFGLHTMGVIHIPFLEYDTRRQQAPDRRWGYLSSSLMGVFFSAGWSPCVGPVLGGVYGLVLNEGDIGRGAALLSAYSLGLGIPFLFAAAGIGNVSQLLRRYGKYLRYFSLATGAFLIVIGVMLFTNTLALFARFAPFTQFQLSIDNGVVALWRWLAGRGG